MNWAFYHYTIFYFIPGNFLCSKVYFVWYLYCHSSFLLIIVCMMYLLPSLNLWHIWTGFLGDSIYLSLAFLIQSDSLFCLIGVLGPVSVIIDEFKFTILFFIYHISTLLLFLFEFSYFNLIGYFNILYFLHYWLTTYVLFS